MRESSTHIHQNRETYIKKHIPQRSYTAMILSFFFPGLGQLYLGKYLKGCIFIFVFTSALILFYMNSYPVNEWRDLLRFNNGSQTGSATNNKTDANPGSDGSVHLWTLEDGKSLMFRPSWVLKITSIIQALIVWLYAINDGWRGREQIGTAHI